MAAKQTLDQHFQQTKPKNQNSKSFYGKKEILPLQEYLINFKPKEHTTYVPTVKKLISFSSDESDSDSDSENFLACKRPINSTEDDKHNGASPIKRANLSKRLAISSKVTTPKKKPNSCEKATITSKKLHADKYQNARLALHSSIPENLVARDKEMTELYNFVTNHLNNKTSGSIYISGPPGTGKTAGLTKITKDLPKNVLQIYVNCTSLKAPNAIYHKISEELKLNADKKDGKNAIEKYLLKGPTRRKPILIILDEIDNLESKNQSVLYTIFEWPSIAKTKFILIGIANALDLTDRVLPRLQARCEVKPTVMHFKPYTNDQIVAIITDRLQQANVTEIFANNALDFLARKVSSLSGDIRTTLDICRRLFEFAEMQRNSNENIVNGELVKVGVKEVMTLINQIYGGSQNIDEAENKFPLQQKLLLCSLILLLNKGKKKDVTISRLYAVYRKVCRKRNVNLVDNSEFVSLCSLVETRGIIRIISKKDAQLSKIALEWDQDQLTAALSDKDLTYEIINDESCL